MIRYISLQKLSFLIWNQILEYIISKEKVFSKLHPNTQRTLKTLTISGWLLSIYIHSSPEKLKTRIARGSNGKILGWLAIYNNKIAMFYIRPEYRKLGIGSALAEYVNKRKHRAREGIAGSCDFFEKCGIKIQWR